MEEGGRQAHGNVGRGHLVLLHAGDHLSEEEEEALEGFPVLVGKEVDGCLNPGKLLIFGEVWRNIKDSKCINS